MSQEQSGNESVCSKKIFYLISYVPTKREKKSNFFTFATKFKFFLVLVTFARNVHICTIIILVVIKDYESAFDSVT